MDLDIDIIFDTVMSAFHTEGIAVLMIGGHAVNHYGVTRATQDIDFMIAAADEDDVHRIMRKVGFTNIAAYENVVFFNRPGSSLRIDFLKADRNTMDKLWANSNEIEYWGEKRVNVPQLQDLLRMKIFALSQGGPKREDKDFYDIVNLVVENDVDADNTLRKLCDEQGSDELYSKLLKRIEEMTEND